MKDLKVKSTTAIVLGLIFLISSTASEAKDQVRSAWLRVLFNSSSNGTPYEKLEELFNSAGPITLEQFPTPEHVPETFNDTNIVPKGWNCVLVGKEDGIDSVQPLDFMYLRVSAQVILVPAVPPQPSAGPLFPGTPGKPAVTKSEPFLMLYPIDRDLDLSPTYLKQVYSEQKVRLSSSPDLVQVVEFRDSDGLAIRETDSFRAINGLIVLKIECDKKYSTHFGYCYKE